MTMAEIPKIPEKLPEDTAMLTCEHCGAAQRVWLEKCTHCNSPTTNWGEQRIAQLGHINDMQDTQIRTQVDELNNYSAKVMRRNDKINEQKLRIEQLEIANGAVSNNIIFLSKEIAEKDAAIEKMQAMYAISDSTEVDSLKRKLEHDAAVIAEKDSTINTLWERIHEADVDTCGPTKDEITKSVADRDDKIARLGKTLDRKQAVIDLMQVDINTLEDMGTVEKLKRKIEHDAAVIAEKERIIDSLQAANELEKKMLGGQLTSQEQQLSDKSLKITQLEGAQSLLREEYTDKKKKWSKWEDELIGRVDSKDLKIKDQALAITLHENSIENYLDTIRIQAKELNRIGDEVMRLDSEKSLMGARHVTNIVRACAECSHPAVLPMPEIESKKGDEFVTVLCNRERLLHGKDPGECTIVSKFVDMHKSISEQISKELQYIPDWCTLGKVNI